MRRGLAVAALFLIGVLAGGGEAQASERLAQACLRERPVQAGNERLRVYGDKRDGDVYACSLANGRTIPLGFNSIGTTSPGWVRPVAVAGDFVAWYRQVCTREACDPGELLIAEIRARRRTFVKTLPVGAYVDDLVLWADGSAAWVEVAPDGTRTLHRRYQDEQVLAQGDVRDLALGPRATLYWLENGLPRSTSLIPSGMLFPNDEKRPRCGRPGETEHANAWVRVYLGSRLPDYFACSYETGRRYLLDEPDASASFSVEVGPAALAGRLVAWYYGECSPGHVVPRSCTRNVVKLLDVRTGRRRPLAKVPGGARVAQIVLKRTATTALVQSGQVRLIDQAGDRIAGNGTDLALSHGSTLFWTAPGGAPAAAPLK